MKLKIIGYVILVICLICSYVHASGTTINLPEKNGGFYDYEYTVSLEKGWNLVSYSENFPYSAYQQTSDQHDSGLGVDEIPITNKKLREFYESHQDFEDAPIIIKFSKTPDFTA